MRLNETVRSTNRKLIDVLPIAREMGECRQAEQPSHLNAGLDSEGGSPGWRGAALDDERGSLMVP
jgi:hypothetical protein